MEIDRGYASPQFATDTEKLICEFDNCRVFVSDAKITEAVQLISLLEEIANQPLLVISGELSGEALTTMVVNKMRGIVRVVAVNSPGFGERRKALLQDIAIVTGSDFIASDLGMKVANTCLDQLGSARKISVSSSNCTI